MISMHFSIALESVLERNHCDQWKCYLLLKAETPAGLKYLHLILDLIIAITSHLLQGITIISCFKLKGILE